MHLFFYRIKQIVALSLLTILSVTTLRAQQFEKTAETESYIEYTLNNPELHASPPFDIMVPFPENSEKFRIIDQNVVSTQKSGLDSEKLQKAWNLSTSDSPVIELKNPGIHRGNSVASMLIHVSRPVPDKPDQFLITRKLKIHIFKTDQRKEKRTKIPTVQAEDHLFSEGSWYKIPVRKNGIHRIDREYLDELGIDVDDIDPRNIQIWLTPGERLPQLNSAPTPSLTQTPIKINGESDGSFDAQDEILFYADSPHAISYSEDANLFRHTINPYSTRNFVFLTIGDNNGKRMEPVNNNLQPSRTINQFRDFIWRERELHKTEDGIKSGREWYGQIFSNARGRSHTILSDTLPGFVSSEPVDIQMRLLGRSTSTSSFDITLNNQSVGTISFASIFDYNSHVGLSARRNVLKEEMSISAPDDIFTLKGTYNFSQSNSSGFVDWIRLYVTRTLTAKDGYLYFYAPRDGKADETGTYQLRGFTESPLVLDVSDPVSPRQLTVRESGSLHLTDYYTAPDKQFIAQTSFIEPEPGKETSNQNLHGISHYPEYIIITDEKFLGAARELATYREEHDGLSPVVATQRQIFNEFSGGSPDMVALRDYVAFLYNRAEQNNRQMPKYLLFFGNTSYDYKGIEQDARMTNHVFTFQSSESVHRVFSYGSDDFFGLLDPSEGKWEPRQKDERIDIGIGRLPVETRTEAQMLVEKIKNYEKPANFGDWRNLFTFSADDGATGTGNDRDLHLLNADGTAVRMDRNEAGIRFNKVYEFNYPVENTASGRRRPQATEDFIKSINQGTLVMNYSGHGNENTLAGELLFHSNMIPRLHNKDKPTIFVTATCSFGRYDDAEAQSGAEQLLLWNQGGAISAFTTTRVVYTSANPDSPNNFSLNIVLSREMIRKNDQNRPQRFGDIMRRTKNTSVGSAFNSRKFILLGDPAMRIGLPTRHTEVTRLNGVDLSRDTTLTMQALDRVTLSGMVKNENGQPLTGYDGEISVKVFDGSRFIQLSGHDWLPNCFLKGDPYYEDCSYEVQNDVLFSGRASVENGKFSSKFIVPKDISQTDKKGRILLYANSRETDGGGANTDLRFQGINTKAPNDDAGPKMDVYLNNERFVNGNLVGSTPRLIVELKDQSGINTTGTGVGHDIMAEISTSPRRNIVLNEFYTSKLNDFTQGRIEYPINELPEGSHTLKVRAWDVYNNPSEKQISFEVAESENLVIRNLYNYPNPMHESTKFVFEHNQAGRKLDVNIKIYTLSGRPVREIERTLIPDGSYGVIQWNGRDRDFDRLATGTYIYVVRIKTTTSEGSQTTEKMEKLVVIN